MNITAVYKPVEDFIGMDIAGILFWVIVILIMVYLMFFQKRKKKHKKTETKDIAEIKQNQGALNIYDSDSDEKQLKHLESKLIMIQTQAKQIKAKYTELLQMNRELKEKYLKVKRQIEILKVK